MAPKHPWKQDLFGDIFSLGSIKTVGDLLNLSTAFERVKARMGEAAANGHRIPPTIRSDCTRLYEEDVVATGLLGAHSIDGMPRTLKTGTDALRRIMQLIDHLPEGWKDVTRGEDNAATQSEMIDHIVGSLGWKIGPVPIPVAKISVKQATYLQLDGAFAKLDDKHADFIREAREQNSFTPEEKSHVVSTLKRMWGIKWEAEQKEAYWRLSVGGFPGFAMHRNNGHRCPCGVDDGRSDRAHHFASCVIANSLRTHIQEAAELGGSDDLLDLVIRREHLWLAIPPHEQIKQNVWDVVCLAAISSMEYGRKLLFASNQSSAGDLNAPCIPSIKTRVIADFWARIQSYVCLGLKPRGWETIPPGHPWIERRADESLWINKPAHIMILDDEDE